MRYPESAEPPVSMEASHATTRLVSVGLLVLTSPGAEGAMVSGAADGGGGEAGGGEAGGGEVGGEEDPPPPPQACKRPKKPNATADTVAKDSARAMQRLDDEEVLGMNATSAERPIS